MEESAGDQTDVPHDASLSQPMAHLGIHSPMMTLEQQQQHQLALQQQQLASHQHQALHQQLQPPPAHASSGTTIVFRRVVPMSRRHRKDLEDPVDLPRDYPDVCSPYVSRTMWTLSGPVIKIVTQGLSFLPSEVYIFRLPDTRADNIPSLLYQQRVPIKNYAIGKIIETARANGCNLADHPQLTNGEWTLYFTVATVTDEVRAQTGNKEVGLWVLHYPHMVKKQLGRTYEDGSTDEFHIILAHVNLVPAQHRLYVPEEGWIPTVPSKKREAAPPAAPQPQDSGPTQEKRSRGNNNNNNSYNGANNNRNPRLEKKVEDLANHQARQEQHQRAVTEELETLKRKVEIAPTPANFPTLPKSQVIPGGANPWYDPKDDAPRYV